MDVDTLWYLDINNLARATPTLHTVLAAYALWGGPVLLAGLLAAGWWHARRRPDPHRGVAIAVLTGVAATAAVLINQNLISPLIARPRPCLSLHGVQVLLACSADYSMPSDHTVIAGALAAGLWLLHRALALTATLLALLLAFARVYVGVHYPSDTIVGLLAGAAVTMIVVIAFRGPATRSANRLADTRIAWVVGLTRPPGPGRHSMHVGARR